MVLSVRYCESNFALGKTGLASVTPAIRHRQRPTSLSRSDKVRGTSGYASTCHYPPRPFDRRRRLVTAP